MIIPGGLVSEADLNDVKFCVQTEFARRPKPRVTTTISRNGEVVEKVENAWRGLPQSEEDRERIESFLKKQHQSVLENIKNRKDGLVSPSCETEGTASSEEDIKRRVNCELSRTDGVLGWVYVSKYGKTTSHRLTEPETKDLGALAGSIRDFCFFLHPVPDLGDFTGGILDLPGNLNLFLPLETYLLAVKLEPKVEFKNLVKRIKSAV